MPITSVKDHAAPAGTGTLTPDVAPDSHPLPVILQEAVNKGAIQVTYIQGIEQNIRISDLTTKKGIECNVLEGFGTAIYAEHSTPSDVLLAQLNQAAEKGKLILQTAKETSERSLCKY